MTGGRAAEESSSQRSRRRVEQSGEGPPRPRTGDALRISEKLRAACLSATTTASRSSAELSSWSPTTPTRSPARSTTRSGPARPPKQLAGPLRAPAQARDDQDQPSSCCSPQSEEEVFGPDDAPRRARTPAHQQPGARQWIVSRAQAWRPRRAASSFKPPSSRSRAARRGMADDPHAAARRRAATSPSPRGSAGDVGSAPTARPSPARAAWTGARGRVRQPLGTARGRPSHQSGRSLPDRRRRIAMTEPSAAHLRRSPSGKGSTASSTTSTSGVPSPGTKRPASVTARKGGVAHASCHLGPRAARSARRRGGRGGRRLAACHTVEVAARVEPAAQSGGLEAESREVLIADLERLPHVERRHETARDN